MTKTATKGPRAEATTGAGLTTAVRVREFALSADEPAHLGGADTAVTPIEMLLGALASCTTITVRMYADRKGWPLDEVGVAAQGTWATVGHGLGEIELTISLEGELSDEQRERLVVISGHCPVHKMLEPSVGFTVRAG